MSSTDGRGVVNARRICILFKKGREFLRNTLEDESSAVALAGNLSEPESVFRYTQLEDSGQIHCGRSICEVQWPEEAGLRVIEDFAWNTRIGGATNVFTKIR